MVLYRLRRDVFPTFIPSGLIVWSEMVNSFQLALDLFAITIVTTLLLFYSLAILLPKDVFFVVLLALCLLDIITTVF